MVNMLKVKGLGDKFLNKGVLLMKILHTSDWHLGKSLEGFSRLEEQEKFIEDFIGIVKDNNVDLVIIAGDIYDNGNPPARAEKAFYNSLKELSEGGKRAILVIAGNHDNPERLSAASPLAYEHGVIILGTPKSTAEVGTYGGFEIIEAGEGFLEIKIKNERAVIITLPYPSEKRLNEIFTEEYDEHIRQKSYSDRIGELFNNLCSKYREDTINLAVSHLFVTGGEISDSERSIELGGSFAVEGNVLPDKAQYIALGHLHRPQRIKTQGRNIYYAGSPLQYSKSEINYSKCAYLVDIKAGEEAIVSEIYFKNYKPIEIWKCEGVEAAIERCRSNSERDIWVYLEIKTDRHISQAEIKEMKDLRRDIIEIKPIIEGIDGEEFDFDTISERSMGDVFKEFYVSRRNTPPTEELMNLFLKITEEEEMADETSET